MRTAIATVCCIIVTTVAWAETIAVYAGQLREISSGHLQIAVMLDGKPLKGSRVDIYKWNFHGSADKAAGPLCFSGLTNAYGVATPPVLAAGDYRVLATLDEVSTFMELWVIDEPREMTTLSMIDLTQPVHWVRQLQDDAVKRAEGLPTRDHLKIFQGIVVDVSGAILPEAKIWITKNEPGGRTVVFSLRADAAGQFSAQLPDGFYLAIFYSEGFRAEAVPFEVAQPGSGNLRVALQPDSHNLPITVTSKAVLGLPLLTTGINAQTH